MNFNNKWKPPHNCSKAFKRFIVKTWKSTSRSSQNLETTKQRLWNLSYQPKKSKAPLLLKAAISSYHVVPAKLSWVFQFVARLKSKHLLYAQMTLAVTSGRDKLKNGPRVFTETILSFLLQKPWQNIHTMSEIRKATFSYPHTQILKANTIPNKARSANQMNGLKKCHGVWLSLMRLNGYQLKETRKSLILCWPM